jgi:hypothetical protein
MSEILYPLKYSINLDFYVEAKIITFFILLRFKNYIAYSIKGILAIFIRAFGVSYDIGSNLDSKLSAKITA